MTAFSTLQETVKRYRRLSGLTQPELAKLAGVGKTVVFDVEHGKETIRFDTIRKILAVLNVRLQLVGPMDAGFPTADDSEA